MAELLNARMLEASRRCIDVLLKAGTVDIGIAQLCEETGLSARTFHRYFPTKAQMARPALASMTKHFDEAIETGRGPLIPRISEAFAAHVLGPEPERAIRFIGLLHERREFWAVYLEAIEAGEIHLATTLQRMFPELSTVRARANAVQIVAASRLALEGALAGEPADDAFAAYLEVFDVRSLEELHSVDGP